MRGDSAGAPGGGGSVAEIKPGGGPSCCALAAAGRFLTPEISSGVLDQQLSDGVLSQVMGLQGGRSTTARTSDDALRCGQHLSCCSRLWASGGCTPTVQT